MGPNQTYKLSHSKGNHRPNEKTTYRMEENICKQCDSEGLNFQNIKQLIQLQLNNNKKQPIKTWAEDLNVFFLQRRNTNV